VVCGLRPGGWGGGTLNSLINFLRMNLGIIYSSPSSRSISRSRFGGGVLPTLALRPPTLAATLASRTRSRKLETSAPLAPSPDRASLVRRAVVVERGPLRRRGATSFPVTAAASDFASNGV